MYVVNWIKCMGGWITCYHISFIKGKIKSKESAKKWKKKKSDLVYVQYTNAYKLGANWNGKDLKNHNNWSQNILLFLNYKKFLF